MNAVAEHRRRQNARGLRRVELRASEEDAALLRAAASALLDPARSPAARRWLQARFASPPAADLKALLENAPLDDIDLARPHDIGRDIEF
jgi:hypothetical protein